MNSNNIKKIANIFGKTFYPDRIKCILLFLLVIIRVIRGFNA